MSTTCFYCKTPIRQDADGAWIDETDGDCCWGEPINLVNENEPHTPIVNVDNAEPTYIEGDAGHLVGLAAGVYERINQWCAVLQERYDARGNSYPQLYEIRALRRYLRIEEFRPEPMNGRSVHAFVDPATGDVFKSASWTKPAKHVRFNVLDDASFATMVATCDPYGSYLYIR
jgi:hypothetical protein